MGFMVYLYGWFYRLRQDGMMESLKALPAAPEIAAASANNTSVEWEVRSAEETGLTGSEAWAVRETLKLGSSHFPADRVPLAKKVETKEMETAGSDLR